MNPRNVGEAILTRLKQLGVEYFFANPGTEFISVIRGFQELPKEAVPTPVLAPHEFQAVSMAYGYYLATKRPQAVMTHANVGAANALIGLIGAARMNIPLIYISGMTSRSERETLGHRDKLIHWSQDSKDQGSIFREYMKWEVEISDASTVYDVLDRAYAIATSAPCGPVAIKISRDVLLHEVKRPYAASPATFGQSTLAPEPGAMGQIAHWLESAERPLVITNRLGIDPAAVSLLCEVSEAHGIGVLTPEDFYSSFPVDHPNHLGFRQSEALGESDLVLVLDTEAPWYPLDHGPSAEAKVVHVGPDPFFQAIPLRSHRGDLFLQSCPKAFLANLGGAAGEKIMVDSRRDWIRSRHNSKLRVIDEKRLTADSVSSVLSEFMSAETVLVNELGLAPESLQIRIPGTYYRSGSASPLGWGVGCALGLCLADRKKTVIAAIGDGVFYLSPMLPALLVSAKMETPFVILVLNNGGMSSISKTVKDFFPNTQGDLPLTSFAARDMEIEKCAAMVAGLGIRAGNAQELRTGLKEAIGFCRETKRVAIINAILTDDGKESCQ